MQGVQAPLPAGEKKPGWQERQVEAWAPEKVPAGQVLQLLEPGVLAYWPAGQTSQESWPASGLKVPTGLHTRKREEGGGRGGGLRDWQQGARAGQEDTSACMPQL